MSILPPVPPPPDPHDLPALTESAGPNIAQVDTPGGFVRLSVCIVLGLIVTSLLVGSYLYFGKHKALATGEVERVSLYPIHSVESGSGMAPGMASQNESYDQLIVFAQVRVHNQSTEPLTILELQANVIQADATVSSSLAVGAHDSNRLFSAYPKLAPLRMEPLLRDTTIAPGQSGEGLLIFNYSLSKAQWEQKKSFTVSVTFTNGAVIQFDGTRV